MMPYLPKPASATPQTAEPEPSREGEPTPERHTVIEVELPREPDQVTCRKVVAVRGGAARRFNEQLPIDLVREGASMAELQMRSRCVTPLSISSKATQALLRPF